MNQSTSPATAHQIYVSFLPLKTTRLRDNEAAKLRSKQKTYINLMSRCWGSGPIHFSYKTLTLASYRIYDGELRSFIINTFLKEFFNLWI